MQSFTDNTGRVWNVAVNVGSIKRVRAMCDGLNILDLITVDENGKQNYDILERLGSDPVLLVDVLFAICQPECAARGVDDVSFGEALSGDSIEKATNVLLEEIIAFFPEAKRRIYQKMLTASRRFAEAQNQQIQSVLDSGKLDEAIDLQLKKLSVTSTSVPESAE